MTGKFTPQETTMNSFQTAEQTLFHHFVARGYSEEVARSIAQNFSQYMMGYITAEGAAQFMVAAGADETTARSMAQMFREIKDVPHARATPDGVRERELAHN